MPAGRPTKYRPEFCQDLIEHMGTGHYYTTFPAFLYKKHKVFVHRDTLDEWARKHQDFSDTKSLCFSLHENYWENLGMVAVTTGMLDVKDPETGKPKKIKQEFNAAVYAMTRKNCHGWSDKHEITGNMNHSIDLMGLARHVAETKNKKP